MATQSEVAEGALICVKCREAVSYVCHHCGAPLCSKTPDVRNGKITGPGRKALDRKQCCAVPLRDPEFPEGSRKSGCLLPFFPDEKVFGTAMHCLECAARHHGGPQGYIPRVTSKP